MRTTEVFSGPDLPILESQAFAQLSTEVAGLPNRVLYLAPFHRLDDELRERWVDYRPRDTLSILTLDDFAGDTTERAAYAGKATHVDRALLYRLVEQGIEAIDDDTHPFSTGDQLPAAGLAETAEDLFTHLEFAGLLSPAAIEQRLRSEGFTERAEAVGTLAASIEQAREQMLAGKQPETFRTERLHAATTTETPLNELWPEIDAVVVGGLTRLRPLEVQLLTRIIQTWPTAVLLPTVTPADPPVGVDAPTATAAAVVDSLDLGTDQQHRVTLAGSDPEHEGAGHQVARHLFRHPAAVECGVPREGLPDVQLITPETATEEVRHIARDIRAQYGDAHAGRNVGIAVPSPDAYRPMLAETLDQYEIPVAVATEISLSETAVGDAALRLCDLAMGEQAVEDLLGLLSNPLVSLPGATDQNPQHHLAHTVARSESRDLSTIVDRLPDDVAVATRELLEAVTTLSSISVETLPERLEDLLERVGVPQAVEDQHDHTEAEALSDLREAAATIALTAPVADTERGDAAQRLSRALQNGTIRRSSPREDAHVIICDPNEAARRSFDRLYVVGLTDATVPTSREEPAFAAPIYDCHPDFERTDPQAEFRHQFGRLVAAPGELVLSVPQRTDDGDPLVEAEVVSELRRIVALEPEEIAATTASPGTAEDIQRSLGAYIGHENTTTTDATELIAAAHAAGTFDETQQTRLQHGVACAAARASPQLTAHDGQLSAETLAMIHDVGDREPYSASRLETYAACGFKYYMERALGIEEPDEIPIEPDALTKGTYIHSVLEHYYRRLQSDTGAPMPVTGGDTQAATESAAENPSADTRAALLLEVALAKLDEVFDTDPTAYHEEWLTKVLAGLGDPAENPYYESGAYEAPERGLFARFLADEEHEEIALATARPTWFEARIGEPQGDEFVFQDSPVSIPTPTGSVPLTGQIDRIDSVPGTDPQQLVVRDYKTGSTPSEADTLGGLNFQLPIYALLAEATNDGVETVGGSYYQVKPTPKLNHRGGQIGSESNTGHVRFGATELPMGTKQSYPEFETHEQFRAFVTEVVPQRLGTMRANIEQGRFHPTVLDPDDAGCSYCPYADVCDVRAHQRHDVMEWLDDAGVDAYVPPVATTDGLETVRGVSEDG